MDESALSIVALLPFKRHSQRIKDKNFKPFAGRPLFMWCLDTLLLIREINKVVINTDARELLLELGLKESSRIEIRGRKSEICGDFVSMNQVIADDIANVPADVYIMTHATNPLLSRDTIEKALAKFFEITKNRTHDSLFTVNQHQARFYNKEGAPINHDPTNLIRTQELEPLFEENSNLYIFTQQSFKVTNSRIGRRPFMLETPLLESIDLDTQERWDLAEMIFRATLSREKR